MVSNVRVCVYRVYVKVWPEKKGGRRRGKSWEEQEEESSCCVRD